MESTCERDWLTQEAAAAFVGSNASFYLDNWKSHSENTLKGWNWAAMFFGIEWMAYRKMYLEAVLSFAIVGCILFLAALFSLDFIGNVAGHSFRIIIGVFGNALYRKKALRVLRKIDVQNDTQRLDALSRRGGASPISVVVIVLLELAYYGLLLLA